MKPALVVTDLTLDTTTRRNEAVLWRQQMQQIAGGRSVLATVHSPMDYSRQQE